jgi:hypothetical protein
MKTSKKLNSKGFSHIEVILAVVVIVAIAGVGAFVYKHDHKTNNSMSTTTTVSKPVGSTVKGSSVMVGSKTLGSIFPSASALNLSPITNSGFGWEILACRTYIPAYGGVYAIQAFYYKPAKIQADSQLAEATNGTPSIASDWLQGFYSQSYFYNLVTELKMNVSVLNPKHVVFFRKMS